MVFLSESDDEEVEKRENFIAEEYDSDIDDPSTFREFESEVEPRIQNIDS